MAIVNPSTARGGASTGALLRGAREQESLNMARNIAPAAQVTSPLRQQVRNAVVGSVPSSATPVLVNTPETDVIAPQSAGNVTAPIAPVPQGQVVAPMGQATPNVQAGGQMSGQIASPTLTPRGISMGNGGQLQNTSSSGVMKTGRMDISKSQPTGVIKASPSGVGKGGFLGTVEQMASKASPLISSLGRFGTNLLSKTLMPLLYMTKEQTQSATNFGKRNQTKI